MAGSLLRDAYKSVTAEIISILAALSWTKGTVVALGADRDATVTFVNMKSLLVEKRYEMETSSQL